MLDLRMLIYILDHHQLDSENPVLVDYVQIVDLIVQSKYDKSYLSTTQV
jgi:hypothetical protein